MERPERHFLTAVRIDRNSPLLAEAVHSVDVIRVGVCQQYPRRGDTVFLDSLVKRIKLRLTVESWVDDDAGISRPHEVGEFFKTVAAKLCDPYHIVRCFSLIFPA